MNKLSLLKLVFKGKVTKDISLSAYLGNTIRGSLGRSLVDLYCKNNDKTACASCTNTLDCAYAMVFQSDGKEENVPDIPNPFVIKVPGNHKYKYTAGQTIEFSVILCGNATHFAKEIILAVLNIFDHNFAGMKNSIYISNIADGFSNQLIFDGTNINHIFRPTFWSDDAAADIGNTSRLLVEFITPVQILRKSKLVTSFNFEIFAENLFSRISSVIDVYGDKEFTIPYSLTYRKPFVTEEQSLKKVTIKQKKQTVEGMVGTVKFTGDLERYFPYVDLGSLLHIGKQTACGFGQFRFIILN